MATFFAIQEKVSNFFGEKTPAQRVRDLILKRKYSQLDGLGNTVAHTCAGDKAIKPSSTVIAYSQDPEAYIQDIEKQNQKRAAEQKEILQKMVEFKLDINVKNNQGDTPLTIAAANGNDVVVDYLLQARADINITDSDNRTPLQLAQQYKRENIALKIQSLTKKDTSESKQSTI